MVGVFTGFPDGISVEESSCNAGDASSISLDQEDLLEEEMVTHSSFGAWRIP